MGHIVMAHQVRKVQVRKCAKLRPTVFQGLRSACLPACWTDRIDCCRRVPSFPSDAATCNTLIVGRSCRQGMGQFPSIQSLGPGPALSLLSPCLPPAVLQPPSSGWLLRRCASCVPCEEKGRRREVQRYLQVYLQYVPYLFCASVYALILVYTYLYEMPVRGMQTR